MAEIKNGGLDQYGKV